MGFTSYDRDCVPCYKWSTLQSLTNNVNHFVSCFASNSMDMSYSMPQRQQLVSIAFWSSKI
jgi:hypothetical protein